MQQRFEHHAAACRAAAGALMRFVRADATRSALVALLLAACAVTPFARHHEDEPAHAPLPKEWPLELEQGHLLRPLALSDVEQRFAAHFPGAIGRFTDGERLYVLRDVEQPTRMLHPAADCYRGLGYSVRGEHLETNRRGRLWRCFAAARPGQRELRVCERIEDLDPHGDAQAWTDSSSWFWDAALGRTNGPWRAVTRVEPL